MILAIIFLYLIFRRLNEDKIKCYVYGIVIWTLSFSLETKSVNSPLYYLGDKTDFQSGVNCIC